MFAPRRDFSRPGPEVLWADDRSADPPIIIQGRIEKSPDEWPEPDPEPSPDPDSEEPEEEPTQPPPQVDKAFLLSMFNMLADVLHSALRKPAFDFSYQPLSLSSRTRLPLPTVEPVPMRPIPAAEPLPGSQLNTTVQDTLTALRTQAQNRLQAKLDANQQAAQGRIHIAQGIAGANA